MTRRVDLHPFGPFTLIRRRGAEMPLRLKGSSPTAEVAFVGHWLDALAKASTGHRDRHRSIDSGTESPPEPRRPVENSPAREPQGMSRRALLRRGAVVGAVVWTTPLLQSALAPAAAASPPPVCTSNCPPGSLCTTSTMCASGLVCIGGVCKIPYGNTTSVCGADVQCQSGNCSPTTKRCLASWPDTPCTADSQCLSGKCNGGTCFANSVGGSCRTTSDCTDNTTCGPTKVCGGVGAVCANNNKCTTGKCKNGFCVA